MARVVLWRSLQAAAGGATEIEIDAENIQQLLARLGEKYPKLKPVLASGVAVSIDDVIYREDRLRPIPSGAEIFILPRMAGG